ncbi:MAG: YqeG family HAD IIIA-type phosphatase [Oscillospiraceae bacterium]|nr:YqeG family HAD IIIA-type phosphatase [Oscillospiraceae bacterium]
MSFSLLPKFTAKALTDIPPDFLVERGVRLLMLDFDNTIVPYTPDKPTALMASWLAWVKDCGIHVCVVSNSTNDRVPRFCKAHGLHCITHARKPFRKGILACMERFGETPDRCVLVGDQIFTDTLGANRCGVCSVLVDAIDDHNIWLKFRHGLEVPFRYLAKKRRITR